MPRRLLNITSIICLVACVALMGLWVRSRFQRDGTTRISESGITTLISIRGAILYNGVHESTGSPRSWNIVNFPSNSDEHYRFDFTFDALGALIVFPYWFLVLTSGLLTMFFRLRWPLR